MKELIKILNQAAKAYYQDDVEIMSNYEYDRLADELAELEEKTQTVFADSPSMRVGYEAVDELPKERHEKPMLSLDKTKERTQLVQWLNGHEALLSWKLDGLTIVITYQNGTLLKAVTRGNGEIGEIITNNAKVFKNVPLKIPYQGELIVRGEAVIHYTDFEKINEEIEDVDAKYKNPRNLCSGSVRQLNNEVTAKRNVYFYAFTLVGASDVDFSNSRKQQMEFMTEQGFDVVEYKMVTQETILEQIQYFAEHIQKYDIPSDGLVLIYEDLAYGASLGRTAKFPRDSIAFKWADEIRETVLREIEWSPSRTGLINPVAIFDPVELEGTTVSRASVHNISIMQSLELGIGDTITVFKANMIIPQIADNLTKSGELHIPKQCPACGGITQIKQLNDVKTLYCINEECPAKKIKLFSLFVSRNALNIDGLSEATLEKMIAEGFIHEFADIFHLNRYREKIVQMEGFGEKSYLNLTESIDLARKTTLPRLIYGLGILNVGVANAKMICRYYHDDLEQMMNASVEELSNIDGVGEVIGGTFADYFSKSENRVMLQNLLQELTIERVETVGEMVLEGLTFVITGSLMQ
ncbi:MAG: NAD-dependent DNA ligase LigA, partial [Clostridia bacterium]|nr:NAD-dependent DNA ligase LigA [Clostridia bacterium]